MPRCGWHRPGLGPPRRRAMGESRIAPPATPSLSEPSSGAMTRPMSETERDRRLDAMTLAQVWSIVMHAWVARRDYPMPWKFLVNNVSFAESLLKTEPLLKDVPKSPRKRRATGKAEIEEGACLTAHGKECEEHRPRLANVISLCERRTIGR